VARFRNVSGDDRNVGRPEGPVVKAGDVATVNGDVTEELEDAYIVGVGDDARAWPKSTWELIPETRKKGE
jgi:hypothetical protein